MKRFISYFLVVMLIPAMVLTGCKDDSTPEPKGDFKTLSTYLVDKGLDLPALLDGWIIDPTLTTATPPGIVDPTDYSIPGWTVFDIRSEGSFNDGHIKGAINVALTDVVTKANALNNPEAKILVVCYTGQTAGRAVMALRLSGFPNAKVSKFGFSAWSNNPEFDSWSSATENGNIAVGSPNWVTTAAPAVPVNAFPSWTSTSTDGSVILASKVDEMLGKSGWGIDGSAVLGATSDFGIYNFWTNDDYVAFGHFSGAFQYKPISLANDVVSALSPTGKNIVYCYTGQTSSFIAAWLQVLGYDVQSVKYGVNSLSYTALSDASKPHWHFPYHEYEYVTVN